MASERRLATCLVTLVVIASQASATCYWRDGSAAVYGNIILTPCSTSGTSACCATSNGDTCLSNGLCQYTDGTLWRGACTSSNWPSNSCSQVCPSVLNGEVEVTKCNDGSFCCETDSSCCAQGRGVNVTTTYPVANGTPTNSSSNTDSSSTASSNTYRGPIVAWQYIMNNAWLATPIIAFIGWCNMWLVGACLASRKGHDYGFIADRRYTGLVKRTCLVAFLASEETAYHQKVIGAVTLDPGFSSLLENLNGCTTGFLDYASWAVQLGATSYAIFIALFVWGQDNLIKGSPVYLQYPLLLGVLNIMRGTWSISVLGCFVPGSGRTKLKYLMGTTLLALMFDWLFICRGLEMASHISKMSTSKTTMVLAWLWPAMEGFIFFCGLISGYWKVKYIGPWVIPFIPATFWLAIGPLYVIAVSILSHFNVADVLFS